METRCIGFFYMGITKEECAGRKQLEKDGLPIFKVERRLPFPIWEGRNLTAYVQIYFTRLPQYEKRLFGNRIWKAEDARRILDRAKESAADRWECREQIYSAELGGSGDEIPIELLAACLYQHRPFDRIGVLLPDTGSEESEQAIWILRPYLSRLRQVFLCGETGTQSAILGEKLFQEFGIMVSGKKEPPEGALLLDLRGREACKDKAEEEKKWSRLRMQCVNRAEALKFLDTTVKNGYNTKVN